MKRILLIILLSAGWFTASAQYTSTLPSGYTPFATQLYYKIAAGDTTFISGATGKGFHRLATTQSLRDSLNNFYTKTESDARFVPLTRTLNINGTTQDLSANRTWSVGTVTSITPGYGLTPQTAITSIGAFGIDTLVLDTVYAKLSDIPTQYWIPGTGTSLTPNGAYGTRITSPIGSGTGVFRSDVQMELYGTNAGLSLFNNRNPGALNSDESFIATGAYDAGGNIGKTSSISSKWYDVTNGAAKGMLRLNTTTSSGAVDNIDFRMFGGGGIAVFGPDDATFPGDDIFKVHGQVIATGTVTMPTPFTLGATSVTTTGTQLNYLNAAAGTTGTTSTNLVFSTSPVLTTPNIGAATFSTLTGGTASTITFANTSAGSITDAISIRNGGTSAGTGNRINFITGSSLQSARINSVLTSTTAADLVFSTMTGSTLGEAGRFLGDKTLQLAGSLQTTAINGSLAANGDIAIQGTTDATRTSSYVNLQPNGGFVGVGTSTPSSKLHIEGASSASFLGGDQLRVSSTASGHRAELHFTDGVTSDALISFFPSATAASRFVEIALNGADSGLKIFGNGNTTTAGNGTISGTLTVTGASLLGNTVNIQGPANNYTAVHTGSSTSGQSYGEQINAGTTSGDYALIINNQSGATRFFDINGVGTTSIATLAGSGDVIAGANNGGSLGKITVGSGLSLTGGTLSATGGASGTITSAGGTAGVIAKFTSASNIENSVLTESSGNIFSSGNMTISGGTIRAGATSPSTNASSYVEMVNSNSATNWRIATNFNHAGEFELNPSTAAGGSTFTTSPFRLNSSGNLVLAGTIGASNFSGTSSGTNTGDQTSVTGNAGTATTLQTSRNIQGVAFNGSANIDIINGTGFVKATGTTLSYDNSTYLTTSSASSTYAPIASPTFTGTVSGITAAMVGAPSGSGTSTGTNTGDQTITLTGAVTGSGTGLIATILASGIDATKLADGSVTSTELQYINSVTSNVQTQLDSKLTTAVTSIASGSGMGFSTITGTGTITMGTPSSITSSSTNSTSTTSHTHAITSLPSATTATTQTAGDNSTKVATTAYVYTAATRQLEEFYSDVQNSGSTITDLYTFTVPANTLVNDGDKIAFYFAGIYAGNTNTKSLSIEFGSGFAPVISTLFGSHWQIHGYLIKVSATTYRISISKEDGSTSDVINGVGTVTNFTSSNIFKLRGDGDATADITAKSGYLEFKPAAL